MLHQRLLFGSLMIMLMVGVVGLDAALSGASLSTDDTSHPLSPQPLSGPGRLAALPITLLAALILILGTLEMGKLCQAGGYKPATAWAAFVTAGLAFVPWMQMQEQAGQVGPLFSAAICQVSPAAVWITGGALGACLIALTRRTTERALANIAVTILLFSYLGLFGSYMVRIRCLSPGPEGAVLLIYVILTIKAGDIGAYFTGSAIGRHKLAPWLSPGKTIEGAIGAVVGAGLVGVAGTALWPVAAAPPFTLMQAAGFGALMAVAGHLGDLVESAFKRDMGLKDSGSLVPGFGGVLDLIDSPLFGAPIAWLALTLL